ncbi:MAG TPA: metalloregulator ArsR/SmtB family transcription factor [Stackebrandtia sp.]|jgi:DNA-binding transcriptional ArsR family regulator|uniref:ArsR/SmtB family transcription factor n=1 Tax=Stackebrandtia sp. TaxID=2023065 RepID=UPI002D52489B|nr:metalloregulator ArsR/SmtB family transcription factor [Stackebrandtia sp.]HZE40473.1 metalloregulator ArsR/SmtB family transcription factor [Stackebrandtia sp.]
MADTDSPTVRFSDPEVIRALGHPARTAVLDYLTQVDDATATECAELVGMSPSAMSYHLRVLARVGLVEQGPSRGDGRERVWRRKVESFKAAVDYDDRESMHLAARAMSEAFLGVEDAKLRRWLDKLPGEPREWYEVGIMSQINLLVTAAEAAEVNRRLLEVVDEFKARTRRGTAPEGARPVSVLIRLFPDD